MKIYLTDILVRLGGFLFSFILIALFLDMPLWDVIVGFCLGSVLLLFKR